MKRITKYGFLIFGITILVWILLKGSIVYERFDSESWKNWRESETELSLRWDMMNNLRNKHELIGKNKSEIIELLGIPNTKLEYEFGYYLGMARYGIDIGNLTIKFNEKGTVTEFKVRRS